MSTEHNRTEYRLRILPKRLTDSEGQEFEIVTQESWAGEPGGVKNVAVYRKTAGAGRGLAGGSLQDDGKRYTPDLSFCEQLADEPVMHEVAE